MWKNILRKKVKKGVTLAEVLITLGIIGIVAAMTIPALITKLDRNGKISKLRKAQSILSQAIKLSTMENEDYEAWDTSLAPKDYIEKYFAPYMKIVVYCDSYSKCNYKSSSPWSRYSGSNSYTGFNAFSRVPFFTLDGILYSISTSGGTNDEKDESGVYDFSSIGTNGVFVDINGANKPNRFGNDVFMLVRNKDGSVMPLGYDLPDEKINADCSKTGKCLYCAEKLRRNGWKSSNDYPW